METLCIAGATVNQTPLDEQGNLARLKVLINKAKKEDVKVLCFPELCITGFGCEDMFFNPHTIRTAEAMLLKLVNETDNIAVLFGLPMAYDGALYNVAAFVHNKKILGINAKKSLSQNNIHCENRWFNPWPSQKIVLIKLGNEEVPFGDLSYDFGPIKIGVEIGEEIWGAASSSQYSDKIDLILNPSASHFAIGKYNVQERFLVEKSGSHNTHYLYTNLLGLEAGTFIYDGGVLIAKEGQIVARGPRFGFHDGALTTYDLGLDLGPHHGLRSRAQDQKTSLTSLNQEEEFLEAEMLGLFDYLRKVGAKGYTLSLSGGCDSASIAVLISHMVATSLKELGLDQFVTRLGLQDKQMGTSLISADPKIWINEVLTCIYQETDFSGDQTLHAASSVAKELGAKFLNINIQSIVNSYQSIAEEFLGRRLDWKQDDLALQNIQARTRSPSAWFIANLTKSILCCTSNHSEASVGYATMDGDTSGGMAPIAGIDKHFLRGWLKWAETSCTRGLGPISSLKLVNAIAPTAELRPSDMRQTDEGDLMPYDVLSEIEKQFLQSNMSPYDIPLYLSKRFPERSTEELTLYCQKFFTLWRQSQWKRKRAAPGFHLVDESIDPNRYPILSGAIY